MFETEMVSIYILKEPFQGFKRYKIGYLYTVYLTITVLNLRNVKYIYFNLSR